jgi:hypothetical protein
MGDYIYNLFILNLMNLYFAPLSAHSEICALRTLTGSRCLLTGGDILATYFIACRVDAYVVLLLRVLGREFTKFKREGIDKKVNAHFLDADFCRCTS